MEEFLNDDTMERLRVKRQLMLDASDLFEVFSKKIAVYKVCGRFGKRFLNNALREVYKDYKKGVKQINEKIPAFVELPTFEKEGKNMYSKKSNLKGSSEKEYTVTPPVPKKKAGLLAKNEDVEIV